MASRPVGLELGTGVRSRRAALKRRIATADVSLTDLLRGQHTVAEQDEEIALDIKIRELLEAVPGVGPTTAAQLAADAAVDPAARLSMLTSRRRDVLAELLFIEESRT